MGNEDDSLLGRCADPQDTHRQIHGRENLKSYNEKWHYNHNNKF